MRLLRTGAAIVALSLVIAACDSGTPPPAGSAAPSPSGSTTSAASVVPSTPSPTPVDVAQLTMHTITDPGFTANAAIDGSGTLGEASSTTTGTLDIEGRAGHAIRTTTTGTRELVLETTSVNGTRYARQKGVWVEIGPSAGTELIALLRGMSGVTDVGVETKDGQSLHHLQAAPLAAIPVEMDVAANATGATASLDAWVTEDGTPVLVTVTAAWTQDVDGKPVAGTRTTSFAFSNVGGSVTVTPPADVWAFHTSKRYGYRMACPTDWTYTPGARSYSDTCQAPDQGVYASRARRINNASLSFLNAQIAKQARDITRYAGLKIDANRKTTLDGVPARRIEFHGTSDGRDVWGQAVFAVKGAWWYFVGWEGFEATDDADRATFDEFLGTFDFR